MLGMERWESSGGSRNHQADGGLLLQQMQGSLVFFCAGEIAGRNLIEQGQVGIMSQVGQLDGAGDGILFDLRDILHIGHSRLLSAVSRERDSRSFFVFGCVRSSYNSGGRMSTGRKCDQWDD